MIACAKCGTDNRAGANFCWQCGYPRRGAATQPLGSEAARATLDRYLSLHLDDDTPARLRALLQPIIDFRQTLWREALQVTFFGSFKSGKSTLINALAGADILPTRVLRATGGITHLHYAPQPCAALVRTSPQGSRYVEPITFDERTRHILLDLEQPEAAPDIEAIQLGIPLELLRQGCTLVDTPGISDDSTLTTRSYRELARSDLVVLVLSAYQLLSQQEKQAARYAHRLLNGNVVFVINQMDTIPAEERAEVIHRAQMVLQGVGSALVGQPRIFATEALHALQARQQQVSDPPDNAAEHTPGDALAEVERFEHWLAALLQSPAGERVALHSRLGILAHHLHHASEAVLAHLAEAREALQQASQAAAAARAASRSHLRQAIAADEVQLGRLENRLDALGEGFVSACLARIEHAMQSDPRWFRKYKAYVQRSVQLYSQQVQEGASTALSETRLDVPVFDAYTSDSRDEIAAAEEWIANIGFWAGMVPGVGNPLENLDLPALQLPPVFEETFAALTGDLLQQTRGEARRQVLSSVEQALRPLLPHLHAAARQYLEQVRARLRAAATPTAATSEAEHALAAAAEQECAYRNLAEWCSELQAVVEHIRRGLALVAVPDENFPEV